MTRKADVVKERVGRMVAGAFVGAAAAFLANKRRADIPSPADGARDDE